ncbi:hypothetical protein WA026_006366 [Henosepilachna vigintioctopunctata]|uniref:NEDD8 ultimate buster 1 n=1 Tax=Henosepilachna vigintioctopunctata TaxID=420089 RepID=A0AAW1TPJ7_9CUCU
MSSNFKKEDILLQVREKLRTCQIKLWLAPYYIKTKGSVKEELEKLANEFSASLNITTELCLEAISELQEHSLENLKQRTQFIECGLATLKIKILHQHSTPKFIFKEVMLTITACELKNTITQDLTITSDRLKLISSGKVLLDNETLLTQGIKNGQMILALILGDNQMEMQESENKIKELEEIKTDSRLLALDSEYIQLEDQFGNTVKVPPSERKALVVAMTLQEKGRSALKRGDLSRALVMFLEADEEFKRCNSQMLTLVDNYALLDLDIAWCYLCLQSMANLPDAEERLKRCEETLYRTYGPNMERVVAVKGSSGNEAALMLRLHLLQAIILYHQNKRDDAMRLLKVTEQELMKLKVDENSVLQLVELGYTITEARIGLRATHGDINAAANYINEVREKKKESRRKAKAEEILMKEKKKLGLCDDRKQYVEPSFLKLLVNMGYNRETARIALQKTNNIISDSIHYIQEHPTPGPSGSKSQELLGFINDLVPELVQAGFDANMAKLALHKHMGDISKAAEELLNNNGIIEDNSATENANELDEENKKQKESKANEEAKKESKKVAKSMAYDRMKQDMTIEEDDYLDLTLQQEEQFLRMYLDLLKK